MPPQRKPGNALTVLDPTSGSRRIKFSGYGVGHARTDDILMTPTPGGNTEIPIHIWNTSLIRKCKHGFVFHSPGHGKRYLWLKNRVRGSASKEKEFPTRPHPGRGPPIFWTRRHLRCTCCREILTNSHATSQPCDVSDRPLSAWNSKHQHHGDHRGDSNRRCDGSGNAYTTARDSSRASSHPPARCHPAPRRGLSRQAGPRAHGPVWRAAIAPSRPALRRRPRLGCVPLLPLLPLPCQPPPY